MSRRGLLIILSSPSGAGKSTLSNVLGGKPGYEVTGGSVTFKWRFYFHNGDEKTAKIADRFKDYAAGK